MHVCTISSRRTGKTASALPPLTAPAYVRLRREAAGMTVDQLARALVLVAAHGWAAKRLTLEEGRSRHRRMLDQVRLIEREGAVIRDAAAMRLIQSVMPFDPAVYRALAETPAGDHPRVCRGCGCSDHDACVTESAGDEQICSLVTRNVCSRCLAVSLAQVGAAA